MEKVEIYFSTALCVVLPLLEIFYSLKPMKCGQCAGEQPTDTSSTHSIAENFGLQTPCTHEKCNYSKRETRSGRYSNAKTFQSSVYLQNFFDFMVSHCTRRRKASPVAVVFYSNGRFVKYEEKTDEFTSV